MTLVTGVSGSGKSTLVNSILYPVLADQLNNARIVPGKHTRVEGVDQVRKVIHVDQNPIGRTPRSNPATYTGVWDKIRQLFAKTPEAQVAATAQVVSPSMSRAAAARPATATEPSRSR